MREIVQPLASLEVFRVVDGGLRAQGAVLLEVLLDVGAFVFDVQAGTDSVGDDSGTIAMRRSRRATADPTTAREQQADAVRTTQVEVVADQFFEEVTPLDRLVEDLSEADLDLPEGESVREPRAAVPGGQRPRQVGGPAMEEALHVLGPQAIADLLQPLGARARQKAVIEAFEPDALLAQPLLDPFVAVQTQLDGIRQVAADLQEGRGPDGILDVEGGVGEGGGLGRELGRYPPRPPINLAGL